MTTITLTHPSWIIFRTKYDMSYAYHSTGICWDGTNFYIVHTDNIRVYKYDSALSSELESYDIGILGGNDNPEGIEWDGTNFFVTDLDANVYKYLSDFSAPPTAYDLTLLGGNANPYGICWDGTNFFIVDNADGIVYKYPSDFSVKTAEYDIDAVSAGANGSPRGICWDGTYFWVTDSDGYLYQYPSDFSSLTASYNIGYLGDTNDEPYGIDYDGTYFFVIDYNNSDIFKYEYVIDVDITSKVKRFLIDHPIKRTPTASGRIFNQALEYDDVIKITGSRTSYLNSKIDQNGEIYKESLDFRSDILRAAPANTDHGAWTDNSGGSTDAYIIDKYNQHCRVIQLEDYDAGDSAELDYALTSGVTAGSIELWIATTDPTNEVSFYMYDEGAAIAAGFRIEADLWDFWDNNGAWQAMGGTAPVIGKWYRVTITFDCDGDSLNYAIVDEDDTAIASAASKTMDSSPTTIDDLKFVTKDADSDYLVFIDAIGFTWDSDYTLGDNANLSVTLANQVLFEGRVIESAGGGYGSGINDIKLDSLSVEGAEIHPGVHGTAYNPAGYAHIANYTEEVIVETINAKCSTITATLTDEYYRGNLTFENDTNDTFPMGWLNTGAATVDIETASIGSHKNTLFVDLNANIAQFFIYFEAQESGTIEFWIRTSDNTVKGPYLYFRDAAATGGPNWGVRTDGDFYYHDGAAKSIVAYAADTWYRCRCDFECGAGGYLGLAADTMNIYIYNTAGAEVGKVEGAAFRNGVDEISYIEFLTEADTADVWLDAFGFSWDKHYNIGDNAHIYIYGVEAGGGVVDFSLEGEHSIERLCNTVADLDINIWKYSPDHAWLYDSGTLDNQITLTKYCRRVRGTDFLERYNDIITKGGWAAGPTIAYGGDSDSDAQTTYGIKTISRFYTSVTSTTTLDSIAAAILSLQGNTPRIVELEFRDTDLGMFAVGETITVPASTIAYTGNNTYLDAGSWLISSVRYDCIRDVNIMRLVNTLFFEYNYNLIEELETLSYGLIV